MYPFRFSLAVVFILFFSNFGVAQNLPPKISGTVTINMKDGFIKADLKLDNLPALDTGFRILLNRGFNMKYFRDSTGVMRYNDNAKDEYLSYRIHNGKNYLPLNKTLNVSYSGAFPVYTDTLNFYDYKGVIALNGKTLRASEQSKWYPVIYDTKNDREIDAYTYDIKIDCQDCKTIYLNGTEAQAGPVAKFTNNSAFSLLLFAGNYERQNFSSSEFLNAEMSTTVAEAFDKEIGAIKKFYETKLKTPYQQKITFVQHKAIEPYGPNKSWGFVTFPSIAVAGGKFNSEIDLKTKKFNHIYKYSFYAHELGHYYFGNLVTPNSTLRWFFLESIPEYLAIKATANQYGKDSANLYINNAKKILAEKKIVPLAQITKSEQVDEQYRYSYGPMLFLALEKRIGEAKVYNLFNTILKHKDAKTDYAFLTSSALESGVSKKEWKAFEDQILSLTEAKLIFDFLQK